MNFGIGVLKHVFCLPNVHKNMHLIEVSLIVVAHCCWKWWAQYSPLFLSSFLSKQGVQKQNKKSLEPDGFLPFDCFGFIRGIILRDLWFFRNLHCSSASQAFWDLPCPLIFQFVFLVAVFATESYSHRNPSSTVFI